MTSHNRNKLCSRQTAAPGNCFFPPQRLLSQLSQQLYWCGAETLWDADKAGPHLCPEAYLQLQISELTTNDTCKKCWKIQPSFHKLMHDLSSNNIQQRKYPKEKVQWCMCFITTIRNDANFTLPLTIFSPCHFFATFVLPI